MCPGIIVISRLTDDTFEWLSDGWYMEGKRHRPDADALFAKAEKCIVDAKDANEAIDNLIAAGFEVTLA